VKGLGSGFIISPDGYIITNDHVAGSATEITVTMTNGEHYDARIIGTDPVSDICLLKIEEENLPYAPLGSSDDIIIGEWVIALGNPFGLFDLNDKPTVTVGVISAAGMNLEPLNNRYYLNMLQTDAAINGGNSGGPLVNSIGEVIGMNTLIYTAGASQGNIGLSFAIPVNKVKRIVSELKENGKIERDFDVGLRIQSLDEKIAEYYNLSTSGGVIITQVASGSPADKAGLKVGDIILEVENYKINNEQTLIGVFQEFRTGQTVSLKIVREEETLSKRMALVKR
jgi:serine protease Do